MWFMNNNEAYNNFPFWEKILDYFLFIKIIVSLFKSHLLENMQTKFTVFGPHLRATPYALRSILKMQQFPKE